MEFDARHGFVAAIAVGVNKTRLAFADLRGERLAHWVMATPRDLHPKALLSRVAAALRLLAREAGIPREKLLAVCVGTPGLVDRERGTVVALAPGLREWLDVPVGRILADALGAPVEVENDVNLAVLGEHWRGAARGHDTCAYVNVGIGIGAGVLIEGRLHRGHHSMAGEIAFMCMAPEHAGKDFGDHGCLETLAGFEALAARWPRGGFREPDRWVAELYDAAGNGDDEARAVVEEVATLVGIAAANLSLVIDPSLVIVGGTVPVPDSLFMEHVQRTAAGILPSPVEVVASALGEEAPLWEGCWWRRRTLATSCGCSCTRARHTEPPGAASGAGQGCLTTRTWPAGTFSTRVTVWSGHRTSTDSACACAPSPKCGRTSSWET